MVGGAYGDIADVLLAAPGGVSSELLQAYRVVVAVGVAATLDASLAAALSAAVEAGGLLILEADDVEAAGAWSWFPGGFFGASLTGAPPTAGELDGIPGGASDESPPHPTPPEQPLPRALPMSRRAGLAPLVSRGASPSRRLLWTRHGRRRRSSS